MLVAQNIIAMAAISVASATRIVSATFPVDLYFRQLTVGTDFARGSSPVHAMARSMNNFVYVVGDKSSGDAAVIDAAWDPDGIEMLVKADNMTVKYHIATHYHWDHIGGKAQGVTIPGIKDWAARGLPVHISALELDAAAKQTGADRSQLFPLSDGQCMAVGRFGLEFIHTPGHSPGSMCVRVTTGGMHEESSATSPALEVTDLLLITGDTVFPGSCGRLDLPGSDPRIMYDSLRKLAALPDQLPIYPGHGYSGTSSTIGGEKTAGLLKDISREQWERMMVRR
jgi:glyoxylase-like metal-dependent hydrolase (beta-lactamase superfamily II)